MTVEQGLGYVAREVHQKDKVEIGTIATNGLAGNFPFCKKYFLNAPAQIANLPFVRYTWLGDDHGGNLIKAWQNIPVVSYLLLRGKCGNCATPISLRYPIIEALSGILIVAVGYHFGPSWQLVGAMALTWALISLTMIDFDHQLLPYNIAPPLLWLGLLLSLNTIFVDSSASLIGAAAGYLALWSVYWLFKLVTGKEGMGYGDFKLLAVLGAWLGWQMLPVIILLSSVVGAIVGIALILLRGRDRNIPIPFGPYLAAAGWLALIWGNEINQNYLGLVGLN